MSSVPALSADVLPAVDATLSGVPLQWEENRSSASFAELASVLTAAALEALQSAQQSASAQQWAEPYLAVNNVRVPAGFAFARESSQRTVSDWLAYVENFCSGMRVAHPVALAAMHLQDEAPLVPCVAKRTRSVWDSVVGIQVCDACILSRGPLCFPGSPGLATRAHSGLSEQEASNPGARAAGRSESR